jgi:hypothetical protein
MASCGKPYTCGGFVEAEDGEDYDECDEHKADRPHWRLVAAVRTDAVFYKRPQPVTLEDCQTYAAEYLKGQRSSGRVAGGAVEIVGGW